MGRWTLTALVINSIIGSGIFGLPSVVASYLGRHSPIAYLIAAAGIGVVIACFAEVSSQFTAAGGSYLYAREAFGRFIGIEIGWLLWLVRLTAAAAAANLFTNYLAEFWPAVQEPITRLPVLAVLIGFIAVVNIRGIKSGAAAQSIGTTTTPRKTQPQNAPAHSAEFGPTRRILSPGATLRDSNSRAKRPAVSATFW